MKRIAIIGGGISGLSAAFRLERYKRQGTAVEYAILESSDRFGGVIRTEHLDGCLLEAGPDSFLTEKPWAADVCRELGLENQLIGSNDSERVTYMLVKGRLVPIPDGLIFMVPTRLAPAFFSPLFSWRTKLRILREWFYPPGSGDSDHSVAEFVKRHYGREMVDRVADPLLAAVYGGSADELSVLSVLPRFVEMEKSRGSLGKAMVAMRKRTAGVQPKPLFKSLRNGMRQMVDALVSQIPVTARLLNTPAESVRAESRKWRVMSAGRTLEFDGVIVATPTYTAADLLCGNRELAGELREIPYSSSVTAVFGFDETVRASLPPGFGFLVPRTGNRRLLAATFVHNKFPHRASANRAVIRCFLGGSRDEGVLQSSEDEIQGIARRELKEILGIAAQPLWVRIYKWHKAMAQYAPGHSERLRRVHKVLAELPGLALAGNAYGGIGVPDCVRSGGDAVTKVLADVG